MAEESQGKNEVLISSHPSEKKEVRPRRLLAEIRWRQANEKPSDAPPSLSTKLADQEPVLTKEELRQRAEACWKERHQLWSLITQVPEFKQWGELSVGDWTKKPKELNALIVLLHRFGIGHVVDREDNSLPQVIGIAFKHLKDDGSGRGKWDGLTAYMRRGAAGKIFKEVKNKAEQNRREITRKDLDVCFMSALACGNPECALELAQMADQFLPATGEIARSDVLSRNLNGFDQAYQLYPADLRENLDALIASIGENGYLADLADFPIAQELKTKAEQRLSQALKRQRDQWYQQQEIVSLSARQQALDQDHLTELLEEALAQGQTWNQVEAAVKARCQQLVDGKIANLLAAELQYRLYPELSLAERIKYQKKLVCRQASGLALPYGQNNYQDFYDFDFLANDNQEARRSKVENLINIPIGNDMINVLYDSVFDYHQLVLFLQFPASYLGKLEDAIKLAGYEARKRYPDQNLSGWWQNIAEKQLIMARKFIGVVDFLQTVADQKELQQLFESEFGLARCVSSSQLDHAAAELQKYFSKVMVAGQEDLSIYDAVLGQLREVDLSQKQIDKIMADDILKAEKVEEDKLVEAKIAEVKAMASDSSSQAQAQLERLKVQRQSLQASQDKLDLFQKEISKLDQERQALDKVQVAGGLGKFLSRGKKVMTQAEKDAAQAEIESKLDAAQESLTLVQAEIAEIGSVDQDEITRLQARMDRLKALGLKDDKEE